jgi:hypothetical protein
MNPVFFLRAALVGGAALCGVACIDMEQKLVLNPDGSGKVTVSVAMAMPDLGGLGGLGGLKELGGKKDPKAESRELAVTLLRAEGIEAWSDVTYGVGKDGKNRTSVTGYFPDATKVRLPKPMDDKGDKESLGVSKDADGNWVVETSLDASMKDKEPAKPADPPNKKKELTDEEVEEKLIEERQQWASMKGFMGGFFEGFRVAYSVEGGGTITATSLFEKKADNRATFEYSGKKLLEAVDAMLQDDQKAKAMIKQGISPAEGGAGGPELFFQNAFGGDSKLRVVMKPGAPAFAYAAEVAKAKAAETAELKAMLEEAKKPAKKKSALRLGLPGLGEGESESPDGETPKPKKKKQPAKID